jgi:ABC-type uncharacterized transport system substrate-binding protein
MGHWAVKRREFIALLGGAATWPLTARAQQTGRVARVGALVNLESEDAQGRARLSAFEQGLQQLGWTIGGSVRIDYRWGGGDADRTRQLAAELVASAPDVILAGGNQSVAALQQATHAVRLYSPASLIPSAAALSRAWSDRAPISPASPCSNIASAGGGWSCSRKLRLA